MQIETTARKTSGFRHEFGGNHDRIASNATGDEILGLLDSATSQLRNERKRLEGMKSLRI
jgi:hypothetical protein